jgi:ketosteroid isomerase-like protein
MIGKVAIGLTVLAGALGVRGDDASAKAAIQKVEAQMVAAMKSGDMDRLTSFVTDDFSVTDGSKKVYNKAQWSKLTAQTLKAVKVKTISMEIVSIHSTGPTAVLHTKSSLVGTLVQGDKTQALVDTSTDEETWTKTSKGWKLKKDITLSEKGTLDGKPIGK